MTVEFGKDGFATESGFVTVFYVHPETGEYVGTSDEYINVGVSLPANSTMIQPMKEEVDKVQVYNGSTWELQEDFRGKTSYSKENLQPVIVDYIGQVKEGYTLSEPTSPYDKWDGKKWVTDEDIQKAEQARQTAFQKNSLIAEASMKIAPLQDAKEGDYIDEEDLPVLSAWQKYRYALTKVDVNNPEWPEKPE